MQEKIRTTGTTVEHSIIHANGGSQGEKRRRTSILGDNGQNISRTDGNNNPPD